MSTDKVWYNTGSSYYHRTKAEQHDKLPVGVYTLDWNDEERCFYLNRLQDRYTFDYKLYDFDANFVKRVGKTYQKKKGNLGVLLCGTKGCGKTVTAKQICNLYMSDFSVPIILITVAHNGIPEFIGEIHQDVLILIDEYEKIFTPHNGSDGYLLSLMDGALSNNFRRTFILTANYTQDINDNLMQRTGRILYLKKYDELGIDVIREIVRSFIAGDNTF